MRTSKLGTILVAGEICCNNVGIQSINQRFDTVTQARKFLAQLTYSGKKVDLKSKVPKSGEFYFYGMLKKVDGCNVKTLDVFHNYIV